MNITAKDKRDIIDLLNDIMDGNDILVPSHGPPDDPDEDYWYRDPSENNRLLGLVFNLVIDTEAKA